jgi:uncharacterized protein (TIGR04222 family)
MSTVILAQGGDTWGISGPTFLVGYLIVGAGLYIAALRARRAAGTVGAEVRSRHSRAFTARFTRPASGAKGDPYLVAFLNGGSKLAVLAGQSALRTGGLLGTDRTGAPGRADGPAPAARAKWPLELAILAATDRPVPYSRLKSDLAVAAALRALSDELVRDGLLVSEHNRGLLRRWGLALLGLFALGVWRLVAGIGNGHPVGFLIPLLLAAGVGALLWYLRLPRRTPAGHAALERLRMMHSHLAPELRPDWAANGPSATAIGVGVFGAGAIWAADPVFAGELAVARATASVSGSLGGGAGSGGSSSSAFWGGGSSCGGGSGGGSSCGGGGGGGCGGGGGGGCGG